MTKHRLFWSYYITLLVLGIFGIFDAIYGMTLESMGQIPALYQAFAMIVEVGVLVFSIIALIIFIKDRYSKITWVLPIFHIVTTLLFFVYGFVWGIIIAIQGIPLENAPFPPASLVISITTNLFMIGFSGYIINRFK